MLGWVICLYSWLFQVPYPALIRDPTCWQFCSCLIPGVSANDCLFRWMEFKKCKLAEHAWTPEE